MNLGIWLVVLFTFTFQIEKNVQIAYASIISTSVENTLVDTLEVHIKDKDGKQNLFYALLTSSHFMIIDRVFEFLYHQDYLQ